MHNDNVLKVSENKFILKTVNGVKKTRYRFLSVFLKKHPIGFEFLTVTVTSLPETRLHQIIQILSMKSCDFSRGE